MSQALKSAGGRAKFGHEAQTGPASPAEHRAGPSASPHPFPGVAAEWPELGSASPDELRLALCVSTLKSLTCQCQDAIELLHEVEDDGCGLVGRVLESMLRVMGAEADFAVKRVGGIGMQSSDEWLLSPRRAEIVRELEGRA